MDRRYFLKQTAAIAPLILTFSPLLDAQKNFLYNLMQESAYQNRILVLIELNGGNDGLNTVIPIDKYSILSIARPSVLIPENKILKLNDTSVFGFHPALSGLQKLYNDKLVSIIHGVGYKDPDFSHFTAKAIKNTATTGKEIVTSGWLGRYLDQKYPVYPKGYPKHSTDGPPAIRVGMVSAKVTQGTKEDLSIGFINIIDLQDMSSGSVSDPVSDGPAGMNIDVVRSVSTQIQYYGPVIQDFAKKQETLSKLYPEAGKNELADQLKTIARLIGSGIDTRVYVVNQTGYDTHGDQVDKGDTTVGKHANLLNDLSQAIYAFEDDLHLMGKQDDVLGMTYSEFGRRIMSSESYGTDHGSAESTILFGTKLRNGMIGSSPDLPSKVSINDNLPVQFDFRSVYRSILESWFGVSKETARMIIPQGADEKLDLFKA